MIVCVCHEQCVCASASLGSLPRFPTSACFHPVRRGPAERAAPPEPALRGPPANAVTMEDLLDEEGVDLDAMLGIEPDEPEPKPPPGVRVDPRRHKVVCKHWLRGLCKKGDDCDFLHQLDRDRMPECWFFSNFGECSNKDCIFLHIRPEDKVSTGLRQVPLSSSPRGSHRPK